MITFVLILYLLKVDQKGKRNKTLHSARGFAHWEPAVVEVRGQAGS